MTTNQSLHDHKVAILATDGFEQSELFEPLKALRAAGADVKIVSLKAGKIKAWNKDNWGDTIDVDLTLEQARAEDFDSLVLPGGVMNPDKLRGEAAAVEFVSDFFHAGKPVSAICHGPQLLIEAGAVRGRKLTSFPSLKTDIRNAGGDWIDATVVLDHGLVTSRKPDDLPEFNKKMIEVFARGVQLHSARHPSLTAERTLQ